MHFTGPTRQETPPRRQPIRLGANLSQKFLVIFLVVFLPLLSGVFPSARAQSVPPSEYQVKAAFLYNFAKFVEWSAVSYADQHAPIMICVLGEDPFGAVLDVTVRSKTANGHELVIKRSNRLRDLTRCEILFISSSERNHIQEILESLRGLNVLTVGETDHFAESGGTIGFVLEGNRIRITVNVDAAQRANLKISSKLLALAQIVRDDPQRRSN